MSYCILQLRGERPFKSRKYDITAHKNYKLLADANDRNIFNVENYLSTKLKLKPNDVYDVIKIDLSSKAS